MKLRQKASFILPAEVLYVASHILAKEHVCKKKHSWLLVFKKHVGLFITQSENEAGWLCQFESKCCFFYKERCTPPFFTQDTCICVGHSLFMNWSRTNSFILTISSEWGIVIKRTEKITCFIVNKRGRSLSCL